MVSRGTISVRSQAAQFIYIHSKQKALSPSQLLFDRRRLLQCSSRIPAICNRSSAFSACSIFLFGLTLALRGCSKIMMVVPAAIHYTISPFFFTWIIGSLGLLRNESALLAVLAVVFPLSQQDRLDKPKQKLAHLGALLDIIIRLREMQTQLTEVMTWLTELLP